MAATNVQVDNATGVLLIDGTKLFPIGFSNPPPLGAKAPSSKPALKELSDAGGNFIRIGIKDWSLPKVAAQLVEVKKRLQEGADNGMHCWCWLGELPANLLPGAPKRKDLLKQIVEGVRDHPGLGAYKGYDEPLHHTPVIKPVGLVGTHDTLKDPDFDPHHPLVLIQAPVHKLGPLKTYAGTFDITGADIFPIANPPANHAESANKDISVVGDVTRKMVAAAGGKPVWMTLQIAWSHTPFPNVPVFPSLQQERFMVYDAIVAGARGLTFFGGHMTQVCTPEDAKAGWNWTFWRQVLRPIVKELSSDELQPALLAPSEPPAVKSTTPGKQKSDVELVTRRDSTHLFVIAVRPRGGPSKISFSGLPRKKDGTAIKGGEVLFEYVQWPTPKALRRLEAAHKPVPPHNQVPRPITVTNGGFEDSFLPHDVHVYRFEL
jgi:hypothetical protein